MKVEKWGSSLAVKLPVSVISLLKLKEGDDVEISIVKKAGSIESLSTLRKYRGRMPRDFKFDRLDANET